MRWIGFSFPFMTAREGEWRAEGEGSPPVAASGVRGRVEIQRPLAAVLKMVLSLWALGQVVPNVDQIIRANSGDLDLGYSGPHWASSETLRWIRKNPIDAVVYSTEPVVVYLHNGRPLSYRGLPVRCSEEVHLIGWNCLSGTGQEQLRRWLADADVPDGAYVVWFHNWLAYDNVVFDYSAADMRMSLDFEPVAEMADGAIFKIDRSYAHRPGSPLSVYESIVSGGFGEPVLRSTFDIHLEGATLIYLKGAMRRGRRGGRVLPARCSTERGRPSRRQTSPSIQLRQPGFHLFPEGCDLGRKVLGRRHPPGL